MNSINFFANQSQSTFDKFINWALTWGRAIVMITEFIALLAFAGRFSLDFQLSNLHDSIKRNQLIVATDIDNENKFRNLQQRLLYANTYYNNGKTTIDTIFQIINQSNGVIQFNSFSYNTKIIQMNISATSINTLDAFIQNLKTITNASKLPLITSINIASIENKENASGVVSALELTLAQ